MGRKRPTISETGEYQIAYDKDGCSCEYAGIDNCNICDIHNSGSCGNFLSELNNVKNNEKLGWKRFIPL